MKKTAFVLAAIILFVGCASATLTPLQRRVMESKELEGTYEDAFRSTMAILQDKQYIVSTSDHSGGIIIAKTALLPATKNWPALPVGAKEKLEISINLEKFTASIVKIRASILRYYFDLAGNPLHWWIKSLPPLVEEPQAYSDFYAEIQKEMFRRAQLNK